MISSVKILSSQYSFQANAGAALSSRLNFKLGLNRKRIGNIVNANVLKYECVRWKCSYITLHVNLTSIYAVLVLVNTVSQVTH